MLKRLLKEVIQDLNRQIRFRKFNPIFLTSHHLKNLLNLSNIYYLTPKTTFPIKLNDTEETPH